MTLFRAVTQIELDDIRAHGGTFQDSPHLSQEKGFFFEKEAATNFALNAYAAEGVKHYIVRTEAPDEVVRRGRPHVAAREGAGVYLSVNELSSLSPAVEVSF